MIKLMIVMLIVACVAPMFLKDPNGEPLMTLEDWTIDLPAMISNLLSGDAPEATVAPDGTAAQDLVVYKWQDEEGQWHFSNTPNDMATAEVMELSQVNIMEAYVPPSAAPEQAGPGETPEGQAAEPMSATPGQVKEMMETVTNLQETIDQRKADMDSLTGFED